MKKIPKKIKEMQKEDGPDNSAERQTNPAAWALRQIDRLSGLDNYSRQEICLCLGEIRRICRDILPEIEAGGTNKIYRVDMGDDTL